MISEADTHGERAREHLARILGLLPQPIALPEELDQALDAGGVAGFAAGKAYRDAHVRFLARLAAGLKNLPAGERDAVLDDPWRFRGVAVAIMTSTDAMEANAVLHLLFPNTFSYMVSETQRQKLIATFAAVPGVAQAENEDRKIELIEAAAATRAKWKFNLYEDAVKAVWKEAASPRWRETVSWARRLFDRDDFDLNERDYKLELAEALAVARVALLEQRADCIDVLRRAFRSRQNNLTNYRAHERFLDWLKEHPADGRAALEIVWRDPDSEDPRLAPFLEAVPREAIAGVGTRVSFASFLLLAVEPTRWPFFKPTPYDRLCKLLRVSAQASCVARGIRVSTGRRRCPSGRTGSAPVLAAPFAQSLRRSAPDRAGSRRPRRVLGKRRRRRRLPSVHRPEVPHRRARPLPQWTIRSNSSPGGPRLLFGHALVWHGVVELDPDASSIAEALGGWVLAARRIRSSARVVVPALGGPDTGGTEYRGGSRFRISAV